MQGWFFVFVWVMVIPNVQGKLYQVVSMFRHGARYHLNDEYDGNSTRPEWGELTAVGMRQHQNLGAAWRKQYINDLAFLSPQYKRTQIDIYSTPFNRTISSALSFFIGFYPLGTGAKLPLVDFLYHLPPYSNKSDAQEQNYALPAARQTINVKYDPKILFGDCANIDAEIAKNIDRQIVTYKQMMLTYQPFLRKMATIFKIQTSDINFGTMQKLYDTLTVDRYLGRSLPSAMTEDDYLNLRHLHNWYNAFKFTFDLCRSINAPKINEILTVFGNRVRLPQSYALKWTFLSAHDTDLVAMMVGLNLTSAACIEDLYRTNSTSEINCEPGPQFAASLIFELHSDDSKNFYVKIKSNGRYVYPCLTKEYTCSYYNWSNSIKKLLNPDVSDICKTSL